MSASSFLPPPGHKQFDSLNEASVESGCTHKNICTPLSVTGKQSNRMCDRYKIN